MFSTEPVSENVYSDVSAVAVVGAGISGLVAARTLSDHNVPVHVFDKGRAPGGRASTRRQGDFEFDHGAQYFTARDERFVTQVRSWLRDGVVQTWDGEIGVARRGSVVSKTTSVERYVGVPRMSALARNLSSGIRADSGTFVADVERVGHRWRLLDGDNESLGNYDAVVVALPPEQACKLLTSSPSLADKASSVEMQPCWASLVVFDRPLSLKADGLFMDDDILSWAARNNSKPGRPEYESWVLHASPEWSQRHIGWQAADVGSVLLTSLLEASGAPETAVLHLNSHLWRYAQAATPLSEGCLWDDALAVGACGDWCHGSRIEGAFLSGLSVAERVLGHSGSGIADAG
ncbi:MAG: FAD-dependent oxidoreductase [Rhodothermales bacterium]|nr:FAD-dependent oxidoreductase [Rhodothermales bacterium]